MASSEEYRGKRLLQHLIEQPRPGLWRASIQVVSDDDDVVLYFRGKGRSEAEAVKRALEVARAGVDEVADRKTTQPMAPVRTPSADHKRTVPLTAIRLGSPVFEQAIHAIGLDPELIRRQLGESLTALAQRPEQMTLDDLGMLLPEIERRLRLLAPHEQVSQSLARLRALLLA